MAEGDTPGPPPRYMRPVVEFFEHHEAMNTRTVGTTRIIEDSDHALTLDMETGVIAIACSHGAITAERPQIEALMAGWNEQTDEAKNYAILQLALTFQREISHLSDEQAVSLAAFFIVNVPLLLTWTGGPESLAHLPKRRPSGGRGDPLGIDGLPLD